MAKKSKTPLGHKLRDLLKTDVDTLPSGEVGRHMQAIQRIYDTVVSRNLKGKEYEKSGKIAKAKALYEANVRDCFDGSHPYERLRIIYTREGQYEDAIRICETYMKLLDSQDAKAKYARKIDSLRRKANLGRN